MNSQSYDFLPTTNIVAVKIDVEGAEPQVLEGAVALIERSRPYFICEALNDNARNDLVRFFDSRRYKAIDIADERNLIFIPEEKLEACMSGFDAWSKQAHAPAALSAQVQVWTRIG